MTGECVSAVVGAVMIMTIVALFLVAAFQAGVSAGRRQPTHPDRDHKDAP